MKFLIIKSVVTQGVYSYNGVNVVTISDSLSRPIGKIMNGFDNLFLDNIYNDNCSSFKVGDADFLVLSRI